jgi:hypothetical protein
VRMVERDGWVLGARVAIGTTSILRSEASLR